MKVESVKDPSHKRPYRVSRSKRHPKAKSIDSLMFEGKKYVSRVAKVVKVYLVRKNLRNPSLNEEQKKDYLVKLKVQLNYNEINKCQGKVSLFHRFINF